METFCWLTAATFSLVFSSIVCRSMTFCSICLRLNAWKVGVKPIQKVFALTKQTNHYKENIPIKSHFQGQQPVGPFVDFLDRLACPVWNWSSAPVVSFCFSLQRGASSLPITRCHADPVWRLPPAGPSAAHQCPVTWTHSPSHSGGKQLNSHI